MQLPALTNYCSTLDTAYLGAQVVAHGLSVEHCLVLLQKSQGLLNGGQTPERPIDEHREPFF